METGSAPLALELGAPEAAVRVEWDESALRALAEPDGGPPPFSLPVPPEWERAGSLRVISAAFEDGRLLAIAALRPRGGSGHDAEEVGGLIGDTDGQVQPLAEVLISTEYGPGGEPRRLGLELWRDADGPPTRAAADLDPDGTTFELRLDGATGRGRLDVVTGG